MAHAREGATYKKHVDLDDTECTGDGLMVIPDHLPKLTLESYEVNRGDMVYFDVETTGASSGGQTIELCQISMSSRIGNLSIYGLCSCPIPQSYSKITGLTVYVSTLCYKGKPVQTDSLTDVVIKVTEFFQQHKTSVTLVAHNCKAVDASRLVAAA